MKKTPFLMMLTLFMLVVGAVSVLGSTPQSITFPKTNDILTGTIDIIATIDGGNYSLGVNNNITNVTFWRVNGSTEYFIGANNSNVNNWSTISTWEMSFPTSSLADIGHTYNITIKIYNGTQPSGTEDPNYLLRNQTSIGGLTVDNTNPTVTIDTAASTEFTKTNKLITATVQNSTGNCQFHFGSNYYVGTRSGLTCSYTVEAGSPADGAYSVYVFATDGNDTTNSARKDFFVDFSNPASTGGIGSAKLAEVAVQKKSSDNMAFIFILIAAVVVLPMMSKKKR